MPGFDGKGPMGEGSMTGGARGFCIQPYTNGKRGSGNSNFAVGYGRGGGRGFGRGRCVGRGRGFGQGYGRGNWREVGDTPYSPAMTQKDEIEVLKDESESLKQELENIQKRIKDLEKSKS